MTGLMDKDPTKKDGDGGYPSGGLCYRVFIPASYPGRRKGNL